MCRDVSGDLERKWDHLSNGIESQADHQQPIESQCDARAGWQTAFHRRQQASGFGEKCLAGDGVMPDTRPQFSGVGEFVIAVTKLDAVDVQLEPFGDGGWSCASHASQRGLRRRIVEHKRWLIVTKMRLDSLGQQQIQLTVAVVRQQTFWRTDSQSPSQRYDLGRRPREDF